MYFEARQILRSRAFVGLGLLVIATLVVVYLGFAASRSNTEASVKCLPRHGMQICYPHTWEMSESEGDIYIESPVGENPPFMSMVIEIGHKASESRFVTEEEIVEISFHNGQLLDTFLYDRGNSFEFSKPPKSNRHYGQLVSSWKKGLLMFYTYAGKLKIGYWREVIVVLFPVDYGYLSISCRIFSIDSGTMPDQQAGFVNSLIHACETLVANADAK